MDLEDTLLIYFDWDLQIGYELYSSPFQQLLDLVVVVNHHTQILAFVDLSYQPPSLSDLLGKLDIFVFHNIEASLVYRLDISEAQASNIFKLDTIDHSTDLCIFIKE